MLSTTTFTNGRAVLHHIQKGYIHLEKLRYRTPSRDMVKQCTYNTTLLRVRAAIFAMEKEQCVLCVLLNYT